MARRLRWLPLLALLCAPSISSAGPKKPTGKDKTHQARPSKLPSGGVAKTTHAPVHKNGPAVAPAELDPAVVRALTRGKPLPKGAAVAIARAAGLDVTANDLKTPVTLTPRKPFHDQYTHLGAHGRISFDPGTPNYGMVTLPRETIGLAERVSERLETNEDFQRATDPFHPDFDGVPSIENNYLVLQFRAARSTAYVVSCNVAGAGVFGAIVQTNGTFSSWHALTAENGRVSFAIPSKAGRPIVQVKLAAAHQSGSAPFDRLASGFAGLTAGPWSANRCQILPMND